MKHLIFTLLIMILFSIQGCLDAYHPHPMSNALITDSLNQSGFSNSRMCVVGSDLCIVSGSSIKIYNILSPSVPVFIGEFSLTNTILSLRVYKDSLLIIGDQSGMSTYTINSNSLKAVYALPNSQHFDPFTYNSNFLFLLQSKGAVLNGQYRPDILSLFDLRGSNSALFSYTNNLRFPKDISIDSNNNLFICDSGLKVFDASVVNNINMTRHFNIEANHVVANNDHLLILGNSGLFQYQYHNGDLALLSKINIVPKP